MTNELIRQRSVVDTSREDAWTKVTNQAAVLYEVHFKNPNKPVIDPAKSAHEYVKEVQQLHVELSPKKI